MLIKLLKLLEPKENPKKELIKIFKISEVQSDAILNMRLGSLKKLDELNINKEIINLKEINLDLKKIIKNDDHCSNFLIKEIKDINDSLSEKVKLRRSKIKNSDDYDLDI